MDSAKVGRILIARGAAGRKGPRLPLRGGTVSAAAMRRSPTEPMPMRGEASSGRALAIYAGLAWALNPVARLVQARRAARGKEDRARLPEKRGHASVQRPPGPLVWFHAIGVGESLALRTLFQSLRAARPDLTILLTTGNVGSVEAWGRIGLPDGVIHQFAPLDIPPWPGRFLDHWHPDLCAVAEIDLWPLLLARARARGIPTLLVNTRLTAERLRRRERLRILYGPALRGFRRILVQDAASAPRFVALGADPDRIEVAGAIKQAADPLPDRPEERVRLAAEIGARPLWLAAVTRDGEHAAILGAHARLRQSVPDLLLILAPRRPETADAVEDAAGALDLTVARRSRGERPDATVAILIADTLGEMGIWYRLSPLAFIGHSLPEPDVPQIGKNPFEAMALGCLVLHGPGRRHTQEIYDAIEGAGASVPVANAEALAPAILAHLDPAARAAPLAAAAVFLAEARRPLERTRELILETLPPA